MNSRDYVSKIRSLCQSIEIEAMKSNTKRTRKTSTSASSNILGLQQNNPPKLIDENGSKAGNNQPEVKSKQGSSLPQTVQVNFKLVQPRAKRVSLCSEFNGWSPEATPMDRLQDGQWSVTLGLKPGRYQYKFLVDGEWIPDPNACENFVNQYGTLNSVVEIRA